MYGSELFAPKVIAFDFDETISTNEAVFTNVMKMFELAGYHVIIVTWRTEAEWPEDFDNLRKLGYKVYCTGRKSKRDFMAMQGIKVDIWVDDTPEAIIYDMGNIPWAM
jgi:hypothetical protein